MATTYTLNTALDRLDGDDGSWIARIDTVGAAEVYAHQYPDTGGISLWREALVPQYGHDDALSALARWAARHGSVVAAECALPGDYDFLGQGLPPVTGKCCHVMFGRDDVDDDVPLVTAS